MTPRLFSFLVFQQSNQKKSTSMRTSAGSTKTAQLPESLIQRQRAVSRASTAHEMRTEEVAMMSLNRRTKEHDEGSCVIIQI